MKNLINYTNERLNNWYKNAKQDFNVVGSATCKIEGNGFIVNYTENGVSKTWSMAFYPEYVSENGLNYFFDCWSAEG